MTYINRFVIVMSLIILGSLLIAGSAQTQMAPRAPHAPLAPGVHQAGLATKKHWRLVAQGEWNGKPVKRSPLNTIRYTSAEACAKDGTALPPPPARIEEKNINFLISCMPYTTADTDKETPIGGEVLE